MSLTYCSLLSPLLCNLLVIASVILFASSEEFFWPTLNSDLALVDTFNINDALQNQLTVLLNNLAVQIDRLLKEDSDYKSGKKKEELTNWWLRLIEKEATAFLVDKGWNVVCFR